MTGYGSSQIYKQWVMAALLLLFLICGSLAHGKNTLDFIYPAGKEVEPYSMYLEILANLDSPLIKPHKVVGPSSAVTYPLDYRGRRFLKQRNPYLMLVKSSMVADIIEGKGPYFYNQPSPELKIIAKGPVQLDLLITTNSTMSMVEDLVGMRVGISSRMEEMFHENSELRYFGSGHNIHNQIRWVRKGSMASARLMLEGRLDAMILSIPARVERNSKGILVGTQLAEHPALELLKRSGKPLKLVSYDPGVISTAFDSLRDGLFGVRLQLEPNPFVGDMETWSLGRYWVLAGHQRIEKKDIISIFSYLRMYPRQDGPDNQIILNPGYMFPDDFGLHVWRHSALLEVRE
ncbi:MAG: hypothetical protein D6B25_07500 [Desulfobulbaceae bacterium]|nr:MAG: hypothetical protein D6B25_07500 [Desulfobulbaceae bacterium]